MTIRNAAVGAMTTPFRTTVTLLPATFVAVSSTSRLPAGLLRSTSTVMPPNCGKRPGVLPGRLSANPCSSKRASSAPVMDNTERPLLNRSEFSMSSCEMSPACFPAAGLAAGGNSEPSSATDPMPSRMPPPFFKEMPMVLSAVICRAANRFASAVRLPRLVSWVRTIARRPSRNTSVWPNRLPSFAAMTELIASVTCLTLAPLPLSSAVAGSNPRLIKPWSSVAKAPLTAGSMLVGSTLPAASNVTTIRPTYRHPPSVLTITVELPSRLVLTTGYAASTLSPARR